MARLLAEVYAAAVGGTPEDWALADRVLAAERHTAVLISPDRVHTNPADR